jgi:predicted nucleic acid-binding protein
MVLKFLLDTNIVLYFLGDRIDDELPEGEYFVSVVTEIELLSYSPLDAASEAQIREFLKTVTIVGSRRVSSLNQLDCDAGTDLSYPMR